MIFRYLYEALVGALCLVLVLFLGARGLAALALLAPRPILMRLIKPGLDERELSLFYKTGNFTLGAMVLVIVVINQLSGITVNGHQIGTNWGGLIIAAFVFIHGIAGLIIYKMG